jgi:hypothetical protein
MKLSNLGKDNDAQRRDFEQEVYKRCDEEDDMEESTVKDQAELNELLMVKAHLDFLVETGKITVEQKNKTITDIEKEMRNE